MPLQIKQIIRQVKGKTREEELVLDETHMLRSIADPPIEIQTPYETRTNFPNLYKCTNQKVW